MLNAIMINFFVLGVIINFVMSSEFTLNVVMLGVNAKCSYAECHYDKCRFA